MKFISYNVNGIRARLHALEQLLKEQDPDVVGLQEVKIVDEIFPHQWFQDLGYHSQTFGQKANHGVAIISKTKLKQLEFGMGCDRTDSQKRIIAGSIESAIGAIKVYNCYFPQGESQSHPTKFPDKQSFYDNLHKLLLRHTNTDNYMVMGDFNVAHRDIDIGIGEVNAKRWLRTGLCCFLPIERIWFQKLMDLGLVDSYRLLNPDSQIYSWFDYRSGGFNKSPKKGLRIDYIMLSPNLAKSCGNAEILLDFRGREKPSDHCPVSVDFKF